jgi:hypothetical protein
MAGGAGALALPRTEQPAQHHELSDVVSLVVGDEQRLPEEILAFAPGERLDESPIVD